MPKFVKKPVVVEAFQITMESRKDMTLWPEWMINKWCKDVPNAMYPAEWPDSEGDDPIAIHTLEGVMMANINDYIIKGIEGEIYPCNPIIFHKTYEPIAYED